MCISSVCVPMIPDKVLLRGWILKRILNQDVGDTAFTHLRRGNQLGGAGTVDLNDAHFKIINFPGVSGSAKLSGFCLRDLFSLEAGHFDSASLSDDLGSISALVASHRHLRCVNFFRQSFTSEFNVLVL